VSVINREDAIKAFEAIDEMYPYRIPGKPETYDHYNEGWSDATDKAVQAIEALPDADDGWISVKDRLPDKYGWYLCTLKDGRVNCYYWNNKGEWLDNGKKYFFELYHVYSKLTGMEVLAKDEGSVYWTDWVIAWKPLPKPYKPKEDK